MYGQNDIAFAGMKADLGDDRVESFAAAGNIPFGVVVTDTNGVLAIGGSGAGITVHSHNVAGSAYKQYDCVGVMVHGNIWAKVKTGEIVAVGAVKFNTTTGEIVAAATVTGAAALANAKVRNVQTVAGGVIAEIQLDNPRLA